MILRMVGVAGLEPAASWSRTKHATKLRYTPPTQKIFYRIPGRLSRAIWEIRGIFPKILSGPLIFRRAGLLCQTVRADPAEQQLTVVDQETHGAHHLAVQLGQQ